MYKRLALVIALMAILVSAQPAAAQSTLLTYPKNLELIPSPEAESVSETFTVTTGDMAVNNLQFVPGPLTDSEGNEAVAADAIIVNPASVEQLAANGSVSVTISISVMPDRGSYQGSMAVTYDEQPEGTTETIALTLVVATASGDSAVTTPDTDPQAGSTLEIRALGGAPLPLTLTEDGTKYLGSFSVTALSTDIAGLKLTNLTNLTSDDSSKPVVLAAQASSDPSDPQILEQGSTRHFTISYPRPAQPGIYKGTVEVTFDSKPANEKYVIEVALEAALPTVAIEPEDGELSFALEEATGSYKATFILAVNEGLIDTIEFKATNLAAADGQIQPIYADKVVVTGELTEIHPGDSRIFTVSVNPPTEGASYKVGTYEGTLTVLVTSPVAENARQSMNVNLNVITSPEGTLQWDPPEGVTKIALNAVLGEAEPFLLPIKETGEANDALDVTIERTPLLATTPDGGTITIPAESVITMTPETLTPGTSIKIPSGETFDLPLSFNFDGAGLEPGIFKGEIRIQGSNTEEISIPVEFTLKQGWWDGPFWIWLIGIALGLVLTLYQSDFLEKDKRYAAIEHWKERLRSEKPDNNQPGSDRYQFYGEQAEGKLELARLMLDENWQNSLTQSQALIDDVGTFWNRWYSYKNELWQEYQRVQLILDDLKKFEGHAFCKAVNDQLEAIVGQRHTYTDAAALKNAVDAEEAKFDMFLDVHRNSKVLLGQLMNPHVKLEDDTGHAFKIRIEQQENNLIEADTETDLQNIEQALGEIKAELQQAYTAYPDYLYQEGCQESARKWIEDTDKVSNPGPQWDTVKSKFNQALKRAEDYIENGIHFEQAGKLAHNTWRAAWFYKEAILDVQQRLEDAKSKIKAEVLETLQVLLRENVIWLLTTDYTEHSPDEFEQELFKNRMQQLYAALGQALGDQALIQSPFPEERPPKPVRRLEKLDVDEALKNELNALRSPRPLEKPTPGRAHAPTKPSWLQVLSYPFRRIMNILISFFRDPDIRILAFQIGIHLVAIAGLYWFGHEVWEQDATFGDSQLDYLQLFFFGFGGSAVKDNLLNVVKGWGVKVPSAG